MTKRKAKNLDEAVVRQAIAAANKRAKVEIKLTRGEALAEAPVPAGLLEAFHAGFRKAYADRLEERGLAKVKRKSGPSGSGGGDTRGDKVASTIYMTEEQREEQKAKAKAAGLSWNNWALRRLSLP